MQRPRINIGFSKLLVVYLMLVHCLAFISVVWVINNKLILFLCAVTFLLSFMFFIRRYVLLTDDNAIVKVWQDEVGEWFLLNKKGKELAGKLMGDSVVTQSLVILNFKIEGRFLKRHVVLFSDGVDEDSFRRLRVWLGVS